MSDFAHKFQTIIAFLVLLILPVSKEPAQAAPPSLQEIVAQMNKQTKKLMNIEIHFEYWEQRQDESGNWKASGRYFSGTAWLNGIYHTRGRIHFDKQVNPTIAGAAYPLYEQSSDYGFDGREGRIAIHTAGPSGHTGSVRTGEIIPDVPPELFDGVSAIAVGAVFSVQFANNRSFAQEITSSIASGMKFTILPDTLNGIPVYLLTDQPRADVVASNWIDPNRGCALLGTRVANRGKVAFETRVSRLVEAAPGIWYPVEAYEEHDSNGHRIRSWYRASKVVANNPKFDESVFTVSFPPNYTIHDRVRGITYKTALGPAKLQIQLDKTVDSAISEMGAAAVSLDSAPKPLNVLWGLQAMPASRLGSTSVHRFGLIALLLSCAALLMLLVLILSLIYRRRANGKIVGLVLLLSLAINPEAARATSLAEASDTPQYHSNCALNVAYTTLRIFHKNLDIDYLAKALDLGTLHERECSLLQLKMLYWSSGLDAEGFRAGSLPELIAAAVPGRILNLKLNTSDGVGHFVLLLAASHDDLLLLDPPDVPIRISRTAAANSSILKMAVMQFLSVSRLCPDPILVPARKYSFRGPKSLGLSRDLPGSLVPG